MCQALCYALHQIIHPSTSRTYSLNVESLRSSREWWLIKELKVCIWFNSMPSCISPLIIWFNDWISLEGWSPVTDYSSSAGEESTCNAGDTGLIPWLGRSPAEGLGYPLQYSRASLGAQVVKNLPGRWETWVWSLGWKDPLKEGMENHSSILAWRITWTKDPGGLQSMASQSQTRLSRQCTMEKPYVIQEVKGQRI